jgi:DNA-binding transcriptional MerR regulator
VTVPPRPEVALSLEQLAAVCGFSAVRLHRLVRMGLVEPEAPGSERFTAPTAARLGRMLRLHADLGVNLAGTRIIVDLPARLDRVEAELARLRSRRCAHKEMR